MRRDPYHPDQPTGIGSLSRLETLVLDLRSSTTSRGRIRAVANEFVFSRVKHLGIGLPYTGTSSVASLLSLFPSLEPLSVLSSGLAVLMIDEGEDGRGPDHGRLRRTRALDVKFDRRVAATKDTKRRAPIGNRFLQERRERRHERVEGGS